ncbi:DUF4144 domain-containing protein [Photobacterium leiognathi]|uniref:DUF4144 domain-containing protein n=1 Tax=Photobacterium leiognathi TaxID=553611 RepID=UPI002982121C|nr:DUF4144 domain-containing protein [Photobacterium leiognathi]
MVNWPCILKLDGDDELIYLDSEQQLLSECEDLIFSQDDYVIDSQGFSYSISINNASAKLINNNTQLAVEEVTALIQAHEFSFAEVCLIKIQFVSVSDAIHALKPSD